jgi:negative regulator of sigma E activity
MRDYEELSALLDGERVDPDAVAAALQDPEGRALLVDFVRLRQQVSEDGDAAAPRTLATAARRRRGRSFAWRGVAAAAVLTAGVLIGTLSQRQAPGPPEPQVVIEFEPGREWGSRPRSFSD